MTQLEIIDLEFRHCGPVSLKLAERELICIHGDSGAGKSLLLRAIADLDDHSGQLILNGCNSEEMRAVEWRKQVSLLPEDSQWWGECVQDSFSAVSAELLSQLGFDEDVLNWPINRLSSGEKQRLALLRNISNKPKVLLLDEASANLDDKNTENMEHIIQHYLQQNEASALWVSHSDEQRKRIADRVFKMEEGQLKKDAVQ